jgi:hypothetical protein
MTAAPLTLEASVSTSLDLEGNEISIAPIAYFADGSSMPLTSSMGLNVSLFSSDASIFTINEDSNSLVLGGVTGSGVLTAIWYGAGSCDDTAVATGTRTIITKMAVPVGIEIAVGSDRLSARGNAARKLGLAESTQITVNLLYADGRKVDMTNDARTQYVVNSVGDAADELLYVQKAVGAAPATIVPNEANNPGKSKLYVTFSHIDDAEDLDGNKEFVTIVIVSNVRVDVSPFPTYQGSRSKSISSLGVFGDTNPPVYQEGQLHMNVYLSDAIATPISVDAHTSTAFTTHRVSADVPEWSVVEMIQDSEKTTIARKRLVLLRSVEISAQCMWL